MQSIYGDKEISLSTYHCILRFIEEQCTHCGNGNTSMMSKLGHEPEL